jgi:hypothetical protein
MKEPIVTVIRWASVIPAAALGLVTMHLVLTVIVGGSNDAASVLGIGIEGEWARRIHRVREEGLMRFCEPFAAVALGMIVAPRSRRWVGIALGGVLAVAIALPIAAAVARAADPAVVVGALLRTAVGFGGIAAAVFVVGRKVDPARSTGGRDRHSEPYVEDLRRHRAYYPALADSGVYSRLLEAFTETSVSYEPPGDRLSRADRDELFRMIHQAQGLSTEQKLSADFGLMTLLVDRTIDLYSSHAIRLDGSA